MGISVDRCFDVGLIRSFFVRPEIWATAAEDGQTPVDFQPDVTASAFMIIEDGDNLIGFYELKPQNSVTLEMHANIAMQHREKYSGRAGKAILHWILENTDYQKFVCQVPTIYQNVRRYVERNGFTLEGTNRLSYRKKGNLLDQWMFGATREEIEDYLCQAS